MNDKKLMNLAADNIRILAASMVEKASLDTLAGLWAVPTSLMFSSQSSLFSTLKTHLGKVAIAFSSTLGTCRRCYIRP